MALREIYAARPHIAERGIVLSFMQIPASEAGDYARGVPPINQRFLLHLGDQFPRAATRSPGVSQIQFISRVSRTRENVSATFRRGETSRPTFFSPRRASEERTSPCIRTHGIVIRTFNARQHYRLHMYRGMISPATDTEN